MRFTVVLILVFGVLLGNFAKSQPANIEQNEVTECEPCEPAPEGTPQLPTNQQIAFTAIRTTDSKSYIDHTTRFPFQETVTLLPGTNFTLSNGIMMD